MTLKEIIVLIFYIVILTVMMICYKLYRHWRKKHDYAVSVWDTECRRKDKLIEKLENELKTYKDMERVIKVERVIMQPREFECKFMLHERFVDDTELFKKVITSEIARYMAEELNKDPYLCKVYHDVTNILKDNYTQEHIKVRFRMLPYDEGVVWDDIFKEEE